MTDSTWIDARERKPRNMDVVLALHDSGVSMVAMHHLSSSEFVCLRSGESWGWYRVTHWMPLPPPPERDESKALLEDVFGGEWKKVLPNGYDRVDCGVHATVREDAIDLAYETDATKMSITVHYGDGKSAREALEIARDELREVHEGVGGLLGDEKGPRQRLRHYLDRLCESYQEKRWEQCIDGRYHHATEKALHGAELDLFDARDLERLTGISADEWMMG